MSALAPWLLTRETALLLVGGFVVGIFSGHHWRWVLHFHPALAIPLPERLLRCHRREPQGRLFLPRHWLHDHEPEGDRLAGEPPLVCAARHWHGGRCHGHRALAPALDAPGHHRGYRAFRVRSLASEARHEGLLPGRVARDRRLCWVPRRRHRHHPGRTSRYRPALSSSSSLSSPSERITSTATSSSPCGSSGRWGASRAGSRAAFSWRSWARCRERSRRACSVLRISSGSPEPCCRS